MKKLATVLAVLLIFSITVSAESGLHKTKPVLYVGGGLDMPLSPSAFSDYYGMGIGFGVGVGAQVTPYIEVVGKFYYNQFGFDADKFLSDLEVEWAEEIEEEGYNFLEEITIDGADMKILAFGGDAKYLFDTGPESPFAPFLLAGLGFANLKVSDDVVSGNGHGEIPVPLRGLSATKFSLDIGGGFDYMFSPKAAFWLEGRYALVLTEGDSFGYLPIRAGVKIFLGE